MALRPPTSVSSPASSDAGRPRPATSTLTAPATTSGGGKQAAQLKELLAAMESLPANPSIAMRVLWLVDDPRMDAPSLATSIELDPALTARLLRVANAAFYSPRSTVTNVSRAVVSVGFSTVQALAAAAVTGIDDEAPLPERFWQHAAEVAHAASLVARHFGVGANDAFAAGLLHDMGEAVLCRIDPIAWKQIAADTMEDTDERLAAEAAVFGEDHVEVVGRILRAWHLPETLASAVGSHHSDTPPTPLGGALACGAAFADLVCGHPSEDRVEWATSQLEAVGVGEEFVERVGPRLLEETAALAEVFAT